MKTRGVIGKRIVAVDQERTRNTARDIVFHIRSITLEDGTKILFSVDELPGDYAVDGIVIPLKKDQ